MFIRSKPTCKIIVKTLSVHAMKARDNVRHKVKNAHAFMLKHCKGQVESLERWSDSNACCATAQGGIKTAGKSSFQGNFHINSIVEPILKMFCVFGAHECSYILSLQPMEKIFFNTAIIELH